MKEAILKPSQIFYLHHQKKKNLLYFSYCAFMALKYISLFFSSIISEFEHLLEHFLKSNKVGHMTEFQHNFTLQILGRNRR